MEISLVDRENVCVIRYPNADELILDDFHEIAPFVRANFKISEGREASVAVVTYGRIVTQAIEAGANIILLEKIKPFEQIPLPDNIIFLEEGIKQGGAGMQFREKFPGKNIKILAIDDHFAHSEKDKTIYETCGISTNDIINIM